MQQLIPPCKPQQPDISFPTELLPEVLKRTVQNVVDAFRVPENIVGVQVLGLLSGCLGKVYSLQFNGNRVRSNLFFLIVESSGVGKSRPMDYLRKVITEIETAREYSLATQKSLWKREKKRLDEQYRKLEDSMPCPSPDLQEEAMQERADLLLKIHSLERRLACHGDITIEDITPEALVQKLSDSPDQSLLSASSEAREQVKKVMVGYGGNNLSGEKPYLAGFSGDAIKTDLFRQPLEDVSIAPPMHCNYGGDRIRFGHRVFINANCTFQPAGGVVIGDDVYIGSDVKFYTTIHPIDPEERTTGKASVRPIKIGNKVWLGGGAIILPGVEIGEGSTIGAGSVVTRSIPPFCVAAGNPCRVLKRLTPPQEKI